ncbi:MAG: hypothetical protein DRN95_03465 [Candidatus Hydrothermarchaeota archaeon]|nr:MAG: hypothetical protein DRN95_03465 [Candidatus Hydrothermarchaeota archaeon]
MIFVVLSLFVLEKTKSLRCLLYVPMEESLLLKGSVLPIVNLVAVGYILTYAEEIVKDNTEEWNTTFSFLTKNDVFYLRFANRNYSFFSDIYCFQWTRALDFDACFGI